MLLFDVSLWLFTRTDTGRVRWSQRRSWWLERRSRWHPVTWLHALAGESLARSVPWRGI